MSVVFNYYYYFFINTVFVFNLSTQDLSLCFWETNQRQPNLFIYLFFFRILKFVFLCVRSSDSSNFGKVLIAFAKVLWSTRIFPIFFRLQHPIPRIYGRVCSVYKQVYSKCLNICIYKHIFTIKGMISNPNVGISGFEGISFQVKLIKDIQHGFRKRFLSKSLSCFFLSRSDCVE